MQRRHLTASNVVLAATAGAVAGCGGSKADLNAASITVRPGARVTDNARVAGRSLA